MICAEHAADQHRSRPLHEVSSSSSLALLLILMAVIQGCTADDNAIGFPPAAASTGAGPVEPSEQDLTLLREEVRMQTTHLREIADDLEWRSRSGQQFDRAILLRIEEHVHRASVRVERIEMLLGRFEKAQR